MENDKLLLECYFDPMAGSVPFVSEVFRSILNNLKTSHPQIEFKTITPNHSICAIPGDGLVGQARGMMSFQIRNPINNKIIFLSFCDDGIAFAGQFSKAWMDHFEKHKYKIVQYIGGLGVRLTNEEIYDKYKIKRFNFMPYLGGSQYHNVTGTDFFEKHVTEYEIDSKIRKICCITTLYSPRGNICDILVKHPLFEIKGDDPNRPSYFEKIRNGDYYNKLSKYRMGLSLNGAGEVSVRDYEYFGLNIPCARPLLKTKFSAELIPDVHYIPFDFYSPHANQYYGDNPIGQADYYKTSDIADLIIDKVEKTIDDEEKLNAISKQAREYYEKFLNVKYLVDSFFKICNINQLF